MVTTLWSTHTKTYSKQSFKTRGQHESAGKRQRCEDEAQPQLSIEKKQKVRIDDYFKPRIVSSPPTVQTLCKPDPCPMDDEAERLTTPENETQSAHNTTVARRSRRRLKLKNLEISDKEEPIRTNNPSSSPASSDFESSIRRVSPRPPRNSNSSDGTNSPLVQTQLHLGDQPQEGCPTCKFLYNPVIHSDREAHSAFHDHFVNGYPVGAVPDESAHKVKVIENTIDEDGVQSFVVAVNGSSSSHWKAHAAHALEMASRDLGAEDLSPETLWATQSTLRDSSTTYRYKVYLNVRQKRVKALLLVEHVHTASGSTYHRSRGDSEEPLSSSKVHSLHTTYHQGTQPVAMGIARIWTLKSSRRSGAASYLLDCARRPNSFIYGKSISRGAVAFSATTDLGSAFAKAYMDGYFRSKGHDYDFLTYFEKTSATKEPLQRHRSKSVENKDGNIIV